METDDHDNHDISFPTAIACKAVTRQGTVKSNGQGKSGDVFQKTHRTTMEQGESRRVLPRFEISPDREQIKNSEF